KPLDDLRQDRCRERFRTSDAQLTGCGIGQEFDVPAALLQFVERRHTAPQECASVDRRLDTVRPTIEQPHTEDVLEIRDHLGYGRMRDPKLSRGLGHAAMLHHRNEHVQVPKLEATADLTGPVYFPLHRK